MNKYILRTLIAGVGVSGLLLASCKKNNIVVDQDPIAVGAYAKFNTLTPADTIATLYVDPTNNSYKLPIGITDVSNQDRTISITYTSTNLVQGTHFTAPTSFVIPAGKALDTLVIQGLFAGFTAATPVDTVVINIVGGNGVNATSYVPQKNRFRLIMRRKCNVVLANFLGAYPATTETFGTGAPYGPYTTIVSSITAGASPNTAVMVVQNIWDNGWGPLTFNLNYSSVNPSLWTATVVPQNAIPGSNAGDLSPTYSGQTIAVRPFATGNIGTFSSCDNTFTLRMQLGVTNVGYFSNLYQVNMKR